MTLMVMAGLARQVFRWEEKPNGVGKEAATSALRAVTAVGDQAVGTV